MRTWLGTDRCLQTCRCQGGVDEDSSMRLFFGICGGGSSRASSKYTGAPANLICLDFLLSATDGQPDSPTTQLNNLKDLTHEASSGKCPTKPRNLKQAFINSPVQGDNLPLVHEGLLQKKWLPEDSGCPDPETACAENSTGQSAISSSGLDAWAIRHVHVIHESLDFLFPAQILPSVGN